MHGLLRGWNRKLFWDIVFNVSDMAVPELWFNSAKLDPLTSAPRRGPRIDKSDAGITTSFEKFQGLVKGGSLKQGLIWAKLLSPHTIV